jgi:DNA-binding transcriptional MerR regulator
MITIGRLAKRFNLSRSTLLYYDSIGLLSPAERTSNGYRRYCATDIQRLENICLYRRTGLSLKHIRRIFDARNNSFSDLLGQRLQQINNEISELQGQQNRVLAMLQRKPPKRSGGMDRHIWSDLLAASGFSNEDMRQWHIAFEKQAPEKHQGFLEFLGIEKERIGEIRSFS